MERKSPLLFEIKFLQEEKDNKTTHLCTLHRKNTTTSSKVLVSLSTFLSMKLLYIYDSAPCNKDVHEMMHKNMLQKKKGIEVLNDSGCFLCEATTSKRKH